MAKIGICFADGSEEIEGLTVVDLVRRAHMDITTISINPEPVVHSSHKIDFHTDTVMADVDWDVYDAIVLPGGIPGTPNLAEDQRVTDMVKKFAAEGKLVAAICAAPTILEAAGVLEGHMATSNPSVRDKMVRCSYSEDKVVRDGNIITSRAMGTAIPFGLEIVAYFNGREAADALGRKILYY